MDTLGCDEPSGVGAGEIERHSICRWLFNATRRAIEVEFRRVYQARGTDWFDGGVLFIGARLRFYRDDHGHSDWHDFPWRCSHRPISRVSGFVGGACRVLYLDF